jgi:hypothetical protein
VLVSASCCLEVFLQKRNKIRYYIRENGSTLRGKVSMKEILDTPARLSMSSLKPNRSYDDLKISSRTSIKYLRKFRNMMNCSVV